MGFSWVWLLRSGKIWRSSWTWLYSCNPSCSLSEKERGRRKQISERVKVKHSTEEKGGSGVSLHWTWLKSPVRCTKSKHVWRNEGLFLINWTLYNKSGMASIRKRFCFLFNKSLIEVVSQGCVVASGQQSPGPAVWLWYPSPRFLWSGFMNQDGCGSQTITSTWQPGIKRKGSRAAKIPCHLRSAPVSSLLGHPTQQFSLLHLN